MQPIELIEQHYHHQPQYHQDVETSSSSTRFVDAEKEVHASDKVDKQAYLNTLPSDPAPTCPSPCNSTSSRQHQPHRDDIESSPQADLIDGPITDRGWAAWKFVLAAAVTEFMIWGASYGYGSFQDYHQHDPASPFHHDSLTAISSIGTTLLAGQHFIPLASFGLYATFPSLVKAFTYICVIGASLSLLIASFANSVALLIVFQGLLLGIFGGNIFTTCLLWLPNWWDKRRGLATALIFAGSAIGGILWPIIFTQLLEGIGFRWTLRAWALIQLIVSGAAVTCLKPGCPLPPASRPIRWKACLPGFPRSLLSPLTLLNAVVILTQTTAWYSISLNISNYATSMGFDSSTSTGILSAFNASAAITYFVLGYLVDRFPYPLIMATSTMLNLIFTVLVFGFAGRSLAKLLVYVVFFGVSGGGFSSFLTPVSRDIGDKSRSQEFSLRFMYLVVVRGLAAMLGLIVAVQFYPNHLGHPSTYGSYGFTGFIAFISGTLALSTLASLAIFAYKQYIQPRREQERLKSNPVTPPPESHSMSV